MNKAQKQKNYRAIVSSDWNQCLAPCGPFDPIIYHHPRLTSELSNIFKAYTGAKITLGAADAKISELLPEPLSIKQMDEYLDAAFATYKGAPELIRWCEDNDILFMINTTGLMGYFQRVFAKNLLPKIPVISANSLIHYPPAKTDPLQNYHLKEIEDKGRNTERAMERYGISAGKIVLIGDSGGDGPHFKWGKKHGAYLIGSMLKPSLLNYCDQRGIEINLHFGPTYLKDEKRNEKNEMLADFMELSSVFEEILK